MTNETSVILFPEGDMVLEEALIHLFKIGDKYYDTFSNDYLDDFDLETLYNWCLIDNERSCLGTSTNLYKRTSLGNKLVMKFIESWYARENRPWYKEIPLGTLREFFERDEDFRKRLERLLQKRSGIIPPAVPSAPVAAVPPAAPADITSIRLYPQIFAKSGDNVEQTLDNGAAGMVVAGNTARAADGIDGVNKRLDKLIELQQQTANNTASINAKTSGKITRLEDIPPYDPTNKNWIPAADYAEKTGISIKDLETMRSRGEKALDNKSGIHGKHIWRAVGDGSKRRIYYYLYS